jgi:hypothetical protein
MFLFVIGCNFKCQTLCSKQAGVVVVVTVVYKDFLVLCLKDNLEKCRI